MRIFKIIKKHLEDISAYISLKNCMTVQYLTKNKNYVNIEKANI